MAGNETLNEDSSGLHGTEDEDETGYGIQGERQQVNDEDEEGRKLRRYLRLYFYSAIKCRDCKCYFNLIFVIVAAIQISKAGFITKQMMDVGDERSHFQDLVDRGTTTLRHLLLLSWETDMEVPPYPPSGGQYAVYTIDELKKHINFAVEKYYSSENDAVGIYMVDRSNNTDAVTFCVNYFTYHDVTLGRGSQKAETHDACFKPHPSIDGTYNITEDMRNNNMNESIVFNSFQKISLTFHLSSLRIDSVTRNGRCLKIQGIISFTNKDNTGQALVDLHADTEVENCKDIDVDLPDIDVRQIINKTYITVSVAALSGISGLTMVADLVVGICLCRKTRKYMRLNSERYFPGHKNGFPLKEYVCHLKGWNIVVMIGDGCTFTAMIYAVTRDETKWTLGEYDIYTMLLGVGCLLCWICLARYLHFNKKFHLLFKTMYRAIPNVLAYLICVLLLFWGFVFCGYVVLGPYHIKFQNISMAADTLFSTISGDEITVTLAGIETGKLGSPAVWWFAQFYLCLFISIFTIIILNILIAIFNSAYEAIQKEYKKQNKYKKRKENSDTPRKPKIKTFMESDGESLKTPVKWWKLPCIFSTKDIWRCIRRCKALHCPRMASDNLIETTESERHENA